MHTSQVILTYSFMNTQASNILFCFPNVFCLLYRMEVCGFERTQCIDHTGQIAVNFITFSLNKMKTSNVESLIYKYKYY